DRGRLGAADRDQPFRAFRTDWLLVAPSTQKTQRPHRGGRQQRPQTRADAVRRPAGRARILALGSLRTIQARQPPVRLRAEQADQGCRLAVDVRLGSRWIFGYKSSAQRAAVFLRASDAFGPLAFRAAG